MSTLVSTSLRNAVVKCQRCPRLRAYCRQVALEKRRAFRHETYWGKPVPAWGDPAARLLIVGLAPAAHGANRTGRMFTGDSSGDWLYEALHRYGFASQPQSINRSDGLVLTDCYITAAARCAPPDNRPTLEELENCRSHLEREIEALSSVSVVLTLGRIAHERWLRAAGWWEKLRVAERPRFGHGVEARLPDGMVLLSSYHPSRQNTNTGKLTRPMWHAVFRRARMLIGPVA
jgi:uracil-DNA glycosylase family 4